MQAIRVVMNEKRKRERHTIKFPTTVHRTAMKAIIPMIIFSVKLYTDWGGKCDAIVELSVTLWLWRFSSLINVVS